MNSLLKQLTVHLLQGSSGKTIEITTPSNNVSTKVTSITNNIAYMTCMVSCITGGTATVSNVISPQTHPQLAPHSQLQDMQFVIK